MKIILISKVPNYGNIGDIVNVKDGYARNFLIPTKKAIVYSSQNYKTFEDKKKEFEEQNKEAKSKATEFKTLINGKEIIILENASDDGRLYGAVNSTNILSKIIEISKDLNILKSDISLEKPIKDTGVYNVSVNLHSDIDAKLSLVVARNEAEVPVVIKQAKEKAKQEKIKEESDAKDIKAKQEKDQAEADAKAAKAETLQTTQEQE